MTVGEKEAKPAAVKEIPMSTLLILSLVTGLIGIHLIKFVYPLTFVAFVLVWPSFVAAANGVRGMARYGLGTGTSSIGYWGTAVGATIAFAGQFIDQKYSPYAEIIAALIIGYLTGLCADKIIRMKIPHIVINSTAIAGATSIAALTFLALLRYAAEVTTLDTYIIFPLIYITITLAVLHPYNGSLGANENQRRTLRLSMTEAAMTTALFGLVAMLLSEALFWIGLSVLIISIIGFAVFVYRWAKMARAEMYDMQWTGFPPAPH